MKHSLFAMTLLVVAAIIAPGCMTAAKEGYAGVRGGKGSHAELTSMGAEGATPLGKYGAFEIGTVRDSFNGMVPQELIANLPAKVENVLIETKLPTEGSPVCVINVDVFYYEGSGSMGIVLGDVEEALAYVTLVEKATGNQVGKAICVGRTTSRINRGVGKKLEGLARGIAGWIKDRYPAPQEQ
ncbi:MAG: hypothetical protein GVY16_05350 [Planctomycetes bacterium]|jgi:hypothetical protein|nr:hypothetical protein [Planctomycetota bacterium]